MAAGDDGSMWFADPGTATVGTIDGEGSVTRYRIPGQTQDIARGPEGNLWVTLPKIRAVGRITPDGTVTTFPVPPPADPAPFGFNDLMPMDITAGPDGDMWFTEAGADQIARIASDGTVTEYPVPHRHKAHIHPSSITAGPDGAVWFSMNLIGTFGRIDPDTEEITELPPWGGGGGGSVPANSLVTGADGRFWFTDPARNALARMTTEGAVEHFPTSRRRPSALAPGSDGAVWFFDNWEDGPARISSDGVETVFPPLADSAVIGHGGPSQMALAPDGAVWFAAPDANRLVRLECRWPAGATAMDVATHRSTWCDLRAPLDDVRQARRAVGRAFEGEFADRIRLGRIGLL